MNFKEIFPLNDFLHKIMLDNSGKENPIIPIYLNNTEAKVEIENDSGNEWNQEYELIYLAHILER